LIWISGDLDFDISDYAFEVWERIGAKQGITCSRDAFYFEPIDQSKGTKAISSYVSKSFGSLAFEVMSSATKLQVNPDKWNIPQLLVYISQTGDKSALKAYNETILAFKGKRFVSIPSFFRSFKTEEEPEELELGEELGEPEIPDILISKPVFKAVRLSGVDFKLLSIALRGTKIEFNELRNLIIDLNLAFMMGETTIAEMVGLMPSLIQSLSRDRELLASEALFRLN